MMTPQTHDELVAITHRLVDAVDRRDVEAYRSMTADDISSFEPESKGHRIDGLAFHEFFLTKPHAPGATVRSELLHMHVRGVGAKDEQEPDAAVVCYIRITQQHNADGSFKLTHASETRVFERRENGWMQIHFHRTKL